MPDNQTASEMRGFTYEIIKGGLRMVLLCVIAYCTVELLQQQKQKEKDGKNKKQSEI